MQFFKASKNLPSFIRKLEKRKYRTHREWYIILFGWNGTVFPHILSRLILVTIVATVLNVLRHNEKWFPVLKPTAHTLIGIGLGLLLVYRTNASYDRYWEGRKLWGSIVNTTRNIMRYCRTHSSVTTDLEPLAQQLTAYVYSLKQRLRDDTTMDNFSEYLCDLDPQSMQYIENCPNKPLAISSVCTDWICDNLPDIVSVPEKLRIVEQYMALLIDFQGGLERIWLTPIPFSYVSLVHHLLTYYLLTLPMVLIEDFEWYAIPATTLIALGLLGIEQAGIEIEDPFGTTGESDKNSLQLDNICHTIKGNLHYLTRRTCQLSRHRKISDIILPSPLSAIPYVTGEDGNGAEYEISLSDDEVMEFDRTSSKLSLLSAKSPVQKQQPEEQEQNQDEPEKQEEQTQEQKQDQTVEQQEEDAHSSSEDLKSDMSTTVNQ